MKKQLRKKITGDFIQLFALLLFTLIITFLISLILTPITGEKGLFLSFLTKPFSSKLAFGNFLGTFTLLLCVGLAMMISLKAGFFNLGGEGQIYLGGFVATVFLLRWNTLPGFWGIILAFLIGGTAGMIPAGISGFLKVFGDINEMISSYIISLATISLVHFLITEKFNDPGEYLISTVPVESKFYLPRLLPPSSLTVFIFFALILVLLMALFFEYTPQGRKSVLMGKNQLFCRFSGMETRKYTFTLLLAGGFLYGIAGVVLILGVHHQCIRNFSAGYGWNGILVALLAGGNPIMMIGGALFMGWLFEGAKAFTLKASLSFDFALIVEGVLLLAVSSRKGRVLYEKILKRFFERND